MKIAQAQGGIHLRDLTGDRGAIELDLRKALSPFSLLFGPSDRRTRTSKDQNLSRSELGPGEVYLAPPPGPDPDRLWRAIMAVSTLPVPSQKERPYDGRMLESLFAIVAKAETLSTSRTPQFDPEDDIELERRTRTAGIRRAS